MTLLYTDHDVGEIRPATPIQVVALKAKQLAISIFLCLLVCEVQQIAVKDDKGESVPHQERLFLAQTRKTMYQPANGEANALGFRDKWY